MDRDEVEVIKLKKKKRKRPISSHLDLTSLVNKRFMIQKKSFDTIRIKNDLFISRAGREVELCLYHKKLGSFNVIFILTVFCRFLRPHRRHCPKITNFVSPFDVIFFLCGIKLRRVIPTGKLVPSCPLG